MDAGEGTADVGVSVGDANGGSTAPVRDSVAEDVTGKTSRRRRASTIAQRIKQRGRFHKAAAARCSPYTTQGEGTLERGRGILLASIPKQVEVARRRSTACE